MEYSQWRLRALTYILSAVVMLIFIVVHIRGQWLGSRATPRTQNEYGATPGSSDYGDTPSGATLRSSDYGDTPSGATSRSSDYGDTPRTNDYGATPTYEYGYLLELNSSDQLTGGAMNVFSYMCMAAKISPRLLVVEPFVVNSTFGAVLSVGDNESLARENNVKLSDVYDIESWKKLADQSHYNQLASWEDFLQNAPRGVVLVENQWQQDCDLDRLQNRFSGFFTLYKFQVVRTVCLNFRVSGAMSLEHFVDKVYGDLSPESTSLIMDRLPGIGARVSPWQTAVRIDCNKVKFWKSVTNLHLSAKIKRDSRMYIDKYLNGEHGYISVIVRLEHLITSHMNSRTEEVQKCFDSIYHKFENLKKDKNLKSTFMALDIGKYGSSEYLFGNCGDMTPILAEAHKFIHKVYNGSLLYDEWENSFEAVTGLTTGGFGGYVAMLQKELAIQGRCILLSGGGSFQESTANLYKSLHGKEPCILKLGKFCH